MCCRVRHPKLNGFLPKYVVCVKSTGSIKAFNYSCILSVRTDCESGACKDKEDMVSTFPVFFLQVCCERVHYMFSMSPHGHQDSVTQAYNK